MADIFISYSRQDSDQANILTELLTSAGLSVWIDQSGIDVATSWSGEIVDAINGCKAFVVLLSPNSIESVNVIKEVSLASEKRKKILPLDLEPVSLTRDFEYQLAGIQRAPMTNIDAIIRALAKLGLHATSAPSYQIVKDFQLPLSQRERGLGGEAAPADTRKSLMILPFEDLSPTADNGWFADGIVSEMISALSNVKALRVTDAATTKEYKSFKGQLTMYAREMNIRYFVQGDVRKFGDNIKITSRLLDIETGDHLWQDSMKGTMNDIFDIQEKVAEKVVEGLKVHLASDEKKKLAERGTENAEAYELYMKAREYFSRNTRESLHLAVAQLTLALEIDPQYAHALGFKAFVLAELYRSYGHDFNLLAEAELLAGRALEIKPDLWSVYGSLSHVYRHQGRLGESERAAIEFVMRAPYNSDSYFHLGIYYMWTYQPSLAIAPFEKALELKPGHLMSYWNLCIVCDRAHDTTRIEKWSRAALPIFERHLRLVPDDENSRANYATLLFWAGEPELALEVLSLFLPRQDLDGYALYNIGSLYSILGDTQLAFAVLTRSVAAGLRNPELFRTDPALAALREGSAESRSLFEELVSAMENEQNG